MSASLASASATYSVQEAYALCRRLAKSHYENFTVGSWLLPRDKVRHLYAIYAFCRFVDDLGDGFQGDKMRALAFWEEQTNLCYRGAPSHPYMIALQQTIRSYDIPKEPFLKLIHANRMDQTIHRFPSYQDLDYYCQHSANPVGHLVLYVYGYRDRERQRLSDYTCTALQLANFWQDVARDYAMGRIYIPLEDMARFEYIEEDLSKWVVNDAFRNLMAFEVQRARGFFSQGLNLIDTIDGRLKFDVALFSAGGVQVLDAIERQGYDVLSRRPSQSKATKIRLALGTLLKLKLLGRP